MLGMTPNTEIATTIKQLLNRLEDSSSSERLNAIQELQALARTSPDYVGDLSLQRIFKFLYEQASPEEYQETLDLVIRLVKCREINVASANVNKILSESANIELLLDLLEHQDLTVAVMANQVLTEIHNNNGTELEKQIQECPAGMNKLLQRLSDQSREDVRNQALIFVQQLTATNEEMKKTVVFNEGFEILFNIIRSEGGCEDAGPVIQDCLDICRHLLSGSETCQRLFYGLGSQWILQASEFFNPEFLEETATHTGAYLVDSDPGGEDLMPWFDNRNKARCAYLALAALASSLDTVNFKHQIQLGISIQSIVPMVMHWLVRMGPASLQRQSILFLERVIEGNNQVTAQIINTPIYYTPFKKGRNCPMEFEIPSFQYSWRIHGQDERRCVTLPLLLCEIYLYGYTSWEISLVFDDSNSEFSLSTSCLYLFEKLCIEDSSFSGLTVQYILAPVMPFDDDIGPEMAPSLGKQLISIVFDTCQQMIETNAFNSINVPNKFGLSANLTFERSCSLLSLTFLHGGVLTRELATALNTSHCVKQVASNMPSQALLPLLLSYVGRANRLPQSQGFVTSMLRMLSVVASECERAVLQMLENPANLFVVNLASPASDTAGVSVIVQVHCCFFLGSCLLSLKKAPDGKENTTPDGVYNLNQQTFLNMLESKIGLDRFIGLLSKPLASTRVNLSLKDDLFTSPSLQQFYLNNVDSVRHCIFEFYSGLTSQRVSSSGSPESLMIEIQRSRIQELESIVQSLQTQPNHISKALPAMKDDKYANLNETVSKLERERDAALAQIELMSQELQNFLAEKNEFQRIVSELENDKSAQIQFVQSDNVQLRQRAESAERLLAKSEEYRNTPGPMNDGSMNEEVLFLKESVLRIGDEKAKLREQLDQRDRKIALLEEELRSPMPFETNLERKITELEHRNAELKQELWSREAEVVELRDDLSNYTMSTSQQISTYQILIANYEEQLKNERDLNFLLKGEHIESSGKSEHFGTEDVDLRAQIESKNNTIVELKKRINDIQELYVREQSKAAEFEYQLHSYLHLKESPSNLQTNQMEPSLIEQLRDDILTSEKKNEELINNLATLQAKYDDLSSNSTLPNSDKMQLDTIIGELTFQNNELTRRLTESETINSNAERRVQDLTQIYEDMRRALNEQVSIRLQLEQELHDTKTVILDKAQSDEDDDLAHKLFESEKFRHDLENEVVYLQSELDSLRATTEEEIDGLQSEIKLLNLQTNSTSIGIDQFHGPQGPIVLEEALKNSDNYSEELVSEDICLRQEMGSIQATFSSSKESHQNTVESLEVTLLESERHQNHVDTELHTFSLERINMSNSNSTSLNDDTSKVLVLKTHVAELQALVDELKKEKFNLEMALSEKIDKALTTSLNNIITDSDNELVQKNTLQTEINEATSKVQPDINIVDTEVQQFLITNDLNYHIEGHIEDILSEISGQESAVAQFNKQKLADEFRDVNKLVLQHKLISSQSSQQNQTFDVSPEIERLQNAYDLLRSQFAEQTSELSRAIAQQQDLFKAGLQWETRCSEIDTLRNQQIFELQQALESTLASKKIPDDDATQDLQIQIAAQNNVIVNLQKEVESKNQDMLELQHALETEKATIIEAITNLQQELASKNQVALELQLALENEVASKNDSIFNLQQELACKNQAVLELQFALESEVASKNDSITNLQQELESKNQATLELEHEIASKNDGIANLQQEVASKNQTVLELQITLESDMVSKNGSIANLQQELESRNQAIIEFERVIASKNDTITNLQQELAPKNQTVIELQLALESDVASLNETIIDLRQELASKCQAVSEFQLALECEVASKNDSIAILQQDVASKNRKVSELQLALESEMASVRETIANLQQEVASKDQLALELRIAVQKDIAYNDTIKSLQQELALKNQEVPEIQLALEHEIASMNVGIGNLQQEIESKSKVISELQLALEHEIASNNDGSINHQQEVASKSQVISELQLSLENEVSAKRLIAIELKEALERETTLRNEIVTIQRNFDSNTARLKDTLSGEYASIEVQLKQSIAEQHDLRVQFHQLSTAFESVEKELLEATNKTVSLEREKDEMNQKLKDLDYVKAQHNILSQSVVLMEEENQKLRTLSSVSGDALEENRQLRVQNSDLSSTLLSSQSNLSRAVEEINFLQSSLAELRHEVLQGNNNIYALKNELEQYKSVFVKNGNNSALSAQKAELIRLNDEVNRLTKELRGLESDHAAAIEVSRRSEGEVAGTKLALDSLSNEYQQVVKENEMLSRDLALQARKLVEAEQQLEQLSSIFEQQRNQDGQKDFRKPHVESDRASIIQLLELFLQNAVSSARKYQDHTVKELSIEVPAPAKKDKVLSDILQNLCAVITMTAQSNGNAINSTVESALQTPTKRPAEQHNLIPLAKATGSVLGDQGVSPSTRDMRVLHSELIKERRRMHALQDEQNDLLGLLAQQEIEISVFQKTLELKLGKETAINTAAKARSVVASKYGSYTDYRGNSDVADYYVNDY